MGIPDYNRMRWDCAEIKIKKLKKEKNLNQEKVLKSLATPLPTRGKTSAANWKMDTITPSSISIMSMNAKSAESLYITGPAPKFYQNEHVKFENVFGGQKGQRPKQSLKSSKGKEVKKDKVLGYRTLMEAQTCWDAADYHGAYHNIQMAVDLFEEMPERFIARFYFAVFQYIHEPHEKVRNHLMGEFQDLQGKLPSYLNDHCTLFIARLEKILNGKIRIRPDLVQHEMLKKIFQFESKLPRLFFHRTTALLMNPRIDNLDIIYAHVKAV